MGTGGSFKMRGVVI